MKILQIYICSLMLLLSELFAGEPLLKENVSGILNSPIYTSTQDRIELLEEYMKPFITAFGTCMGGAMYHRAYVKAFPRFDFGISFVILSVPKRVKKCIAPDGSEVASVFGSPSDTSVPGTGISTFSVPQLHMNIGFFSNFELTAKYLDFNISKFGKISLFGFGVKYGLSDLIPLPAFPLDLSAQVMLHRLTVDDWIDVGTFGMNLQISKSFPVFPLGFYGGVGFENSSMEIKTDKIIDTGIGEISVEGENNFRLTFGISYTFMIFNIHGDYNIGEYNSVGIGAMITL